MTYNKGCTLNNRDTAFLFLMSMNIEEIISQKYKAIWVVSEIFEVDRVWQFWPEYVDLAPKDKLYSLSRNQEGSGGSVWSEYINGSGFSTESDDELLEYLKTNCGGIIAIPKPKALGWITIAAPYRERPSTYNLSPCIEHHIEDQPGSILRTSQHPEKDVVWGGRFEEVVETLSEFDLQQGIIPPPHEITVPSNWRDSGSRHNFIFGKSANGKSILG